MGVSLGAVERGCGSRQEAGVYAECGLSPVGMPIEYFIQDPPLPVPEGLKITPVGVELIEMNGVTHVVDWVGSQHYANVADFVEETSRFGLSRRLPRTLEFDRLGPGSTIILVHGRAILSDYTALEARRLKESARWRSPHRSMPDYRCPKQYVLDFLGDRGKVIADRKERGIAALHMGLPGDAKVDGAMRDAVATGDLLHLDSQCASLWWEDLEPAGELDLKDPGSPRMRRHMPSFDYAGYEQTTHLGGYKPGIFLRMPISNLAVIKDREGKAQELADKISRKTSLGVNLEEE